MLARFQRTIQDLLGNAVDGASVEVRREVAGSPLASLFSDRDGLAPTGNPITADSEGFAVFHAAGGAYRITATKGAFSRVWRYVSIGTAQEYDQTDVTALVQNVDAGYALTFESETTAPPSAGAIRFNNADLSAATECYISTENLGGSNIELRLLELFDAARTVKDTFSLADPASNEQASWQIDGAALVGSPGDYVTLTISAHAGETSFTDDERVNFQPNRAGADGEDGAGGDVFGPGSSTSGNLPSFSDNSGKTLQDSGIAATDVLVVGDIGVSVQAYDAQLDEWSGVDPTDFYAPGGTDVVVADGGSGRSSAVAYAPICGGTTSTGAHQSVASVGTAGQLLTSNGAGALPSFQTPDLVFATAGIITPGSSSFDIALSDYDLYEIDFVNFVPTGDSAEFAVRMSQSSTFISSAAYGWGTHRFGTNTAGNADTEIFIDLDIGNGASEGISGKLSLWRPGASSFYKRVVYHGGFWDASSDVFVEFIGSGVLTLNTNAIDGLRILFLDTTIASGYYTIKAYELA